MTIWLKKLSWYSVIGLSIALFLIVRISGLNAKIPYLGFICAVALCLMKHLIGLRDLLKKSSTEGAKIKFVDFIPAVFIAILKINFCYFKNVISWITRKPLKINQASGISLGYLKKGQYNTFVLIAVIALVVEIPFSGLLIGLIEHDPQIRAQAHVLLLIIALYSLVCIVGDRYSVNTTTHELRSNSLLLKIGDRFFAEINLQEINKIIELKEAQRIWCAKNKTSFIDTVKVSPFDAANVIIELQVEHQVVIETFKLQRVCPKYLFIYVDEPPQLIERMAS